MFLILLIRVRCVIVQILTLCVYVCICIYNLQDIMTQPLNLSKVICFILLHVTFFIISTLNFSCLVANLTTRTNKYLKGTKALQCNGKNCGIVRACSLGKCHIVGFKYLENDIENLLCWVLLHIGFNLIHATCYQCFSRNCNDQNIQQSFDKLGKTEGYMVKLFGNFYY